MKTNANDAAFQKEKWMTSAVPNMPPEQFGGLTKRELFSAMAMQSLLQNPTVQELWTDEQICHQSVSISQALIKALNEKGE